MAKGKRKLKLFVKILLIWMLVLFIGSCFCWIYVYNTMKDYENSQIENYMTTLISDIKKKPSDYFEIKSSYEDASSVKKILKDSKIEYKVDSKDKSKYNLCINTDKDKVCADEEVFASVTLNTGNKVKKLGLLTYTKYEVESVENSASTVKIYASTDSKFQINGIDVKKSDITKTTKIPELEEAYEFISLPEVNYYEIDGFTVNPTITAEDATVTYTDGVYNVNSYKTYDTLEAAGTNIKNSFNPLTFAETWSMFLTAEYDMETGRGLNRVSPNLIEGTAVYTKAYNWSKNVDITFTSVHTLDGFTNEKVSNVVVYNENCFSADVYLEKNMTLPGGDKRQDKLNERMYFIYYNDAYRVVAMKSITE